MKTFLILIVFFSISMSQKITSVPLSKSTIAPSKADTSYTGAGLLAKGGNVSVKWSNCYTQEIGEVYFMDSPGQPLFLFHNTIGEYNDDTIIDLGSFASGKPIVFLYRKIKDEVIPIEPFLIGKNFYTGLNRVGIDPYISDYKHSMGWTAPGRLNADTVEVSYEDGRETMYDAVLFEVTNVYIEGIDKFKVPYVHFSESSQIFIEKLDVRLSVQVEGLTIFIQARVDDTITANQAKLRIYYTTDGTIPSDNSLQYTTGPITLEKTTTLQAIALIEGDTNWFPSEVVSETYTREGEVVIHESLQIAVKNPMEFYGRENCCFDIAGRQLTGRDKRKLNGVFLSKSPVSGTCRRVVYTDFNCPSLK